ncbi:hypothetical protein HGM15179_000181 [Zosterops borbonicus]|uniref:Uncharacterized protein n=1 Tax=Zosterops borbonicus TaxID=364589 RepID=A0A8K1GWX4_9PASS|nr:hypothetical protein HGM15179_000181 [Zosterops borbonicus]
MGAPPGTTHQLGPAPFTTFHHHSLGPAMQPVLNPAKGALVQAMGCQLFQECAMENSVKGFVEIQLDNIHSPPLIHQVGHFIIKGDLVGQAGPDPPKLILAGSDPLDVPLSVVKLKMIQSCPLSQPETHVYNHTKQRFNY